MSAFKLPDRGRGMVRCPSIYSDEARPRFAVVDLTLKIMAGDETGLRQRPLSGNPNLTVAKVYTPTVEGQKRDEMLDKHTEYVLPLLTLVPWP